VIQLQCLPKMITSNSP